MEHPLIFNPGPGLMPPCLAGRSDELHALDKQRRRLVAGTGAPGAILYGPRGNGKTVLLETFVRGLRQEKGKGWKKKPNIVKLPASELQNTAAVHACIKTGKPPEGGNTKEVKSAKVAGSYEGIQGSGEVEYFEREQAARSLYLALKKRLKNRAFILAIDEAHKLDKTVGYSLLNAFQTICTEGAPAMLVLAGTPGLERHLASMEVTFWERGKKLRIGLLDRKAARESLVKPLQDAGIGFDEAAIGKVVEESQQYPYFLQLWGDALVDALAGGTRIEMAHVDQARGVIEQTQQEFYRVRYDELKNAGLREASMAIAHAFSANETLHEITIEKLISPELVEGTDVNAAFDTLVSLGYIWSVGKGQYAPGIPSLMAYCLESKLVPSNEPDEPGGPSPSK